MIDRDYITEALQETINQLGDDEIFYEQRRDDLRNQLNEAQKELEAVHNRRAILIVEVEKRNAERL